MANFLIPFGRDADKRLPTNDERANGFPCGPADIRLFNGMFNRIESEIGEVISFAGLTPDDTNFTQLREAIESLINAATGGGDTSQFLLVSQARARLPIYPDVQNANAHFGVITPATGQIRIPGGTTFLHRGIFPVTTVQTDIATDASKTYHLRWNPTDGFTLKDLASGVYNPGATGEASVQFDSSYDDMLVARVITNSSNVPTITNLKNSARLEAEMEQAGAGTIITTGSGSDGVSFSNTFTLNWSRRPIVALQGSAAQVASPLLHGYANHTYVDAANRYVVTGRVESDYQTPMDNPAVYVPNGRLRLFAIR